MQIPEFPWLPLSLRKRLAAQLPVSGRSRTRADFRTLAGSPGRSGRIIEVVKRAIGLSVRFMTNSAMTSIGLGCSELAGSLRA
jgi:hypothetical protein